MEPHKREPPEKEWLHRENMQNACKNCREGMVLGNRVYCNLDGRFRPLQDVLTYECFCPKAEK